MAYAHYPEFKCVQCKMRRRQKRAPSLWVKRKHGYLCHYCTGKKVRPQPRYVIQPSDDLEWEFGLENALGYQFD